MADLAPTGPVSVAVDALCTLIATVPFFQQWVGALDANAALASVYTGENGFTIVSIAIAGGVCTVVTSEVHTMEAGAQVTLEGASLGAQSSAQLDGIQTIIDVTPNTITFATAAEDLESTTIDQAFIFPGTRPMAVVMESADALSSDSIGTGGASIYNGSIDILIEADVSEQYQNDPKNALMEARNSFGSFVQGLATTQGTLDLMCLNSIATNSGPEFSRKSEQNDGTIRFERWRAMLKVSWGLKS